MRFLSEQSIVFLGDLKDFDERTDRLQEALLDLDAVADPDLVANLTTGEVEVSMVVEAPDYPAAVQKATADLRAAIHTIGDATPGWERYARRMGIELLQGEPEVSPHERALANA